MQPLQWIKKDFLVIIICLLSILACVYTIFTVTEYQDQINRHWIDQWERSGCNYKPSPANIPFNMGGWYNATKNIN